MSRLRGRAIMRTLVLWLSTAIALVLVSLIPGLLTITTLSTALWAAVVISLIDALVWPIVLYFALPLTVLTLGLIVVAVNGIVLLLVSQFTPGFHVDGFWAGLAAALLVTIVNTVVASLLAIDDDGFWFRYVVGRYQRRAAPAADTDVPGLFFLEIDGLAHDILVRAMRDGNAPHLAKLVREGSHELTRWETDWSSQTGACQAGILHGSNADMPAFRWWEKDLGKAIVTNHPRDAQEIERRHSERPRAALRRRCEPREHRLRRRPLQPADDVNGPEPLAPGPARARSTTPTSRAPTTWCARSCSRSATSPGSGAAPSTRAASTCSRGSNATAPTRWSAPGRP